VHALCVPRLLRICDSRSDMNDNNAMGNPMIASAMKGDLFVFDKGCSGRDVLLSIHNKDAFFLTPLHSQKVRTLRVLFTSELNMKDMAAPKAGEPDFVVTSVEECIFENGQPTRCAKYKDMKLALVTFWRYDQHSHIWRSVTVMTDLPISADGKRIGPYTYEEIALIYRDRWQIEHFFKKIKGHLSFDHLVNRSKNGIEIMVYMTLIAAMLMIWAKRVTGVTTGWGPVKVWLESGCRNWISELIRTQTHLYRQTARAG